MQVDAPVLAKILDFCLTVAAPVATMFAMWIAHRVVKLFEDKAKVQIPAQWQTAIDDWVSKGVAFAEQKAETAIKNGGDKLKGPEKLEMAVGFVLDMAQQHGLDALARDKIIKLVEAELGLSQ